MLLVALNGAWQYRARIHDVLDPRLANAELWVQGEVATLPRTYPDHVRFVFHPPEHQARIAGLPGSIEVRWYEDFASLRPGQTWRFKLRLRPPRARVNFQGFDRERALFATGIGAVATVLEAGSPPPQVAGTSGVHALRAAVGDRIRSVLPPGPGRALVLSLAIADRGELEGADWNLLRATGTGHLLAISGLHVGLAAVAGFWLARAILFAFPIGSGGSRATFLSSCAGAFLAALAYGALAGFPVSTLRALAMLAVGLLVIAGRRGVGAFRAWLLAVAAVVLVDPFAPLTPGFWLSFGAVLALIVCFAPRTHPVSWWAALPRAQLAVMAVMLPLAAFWFQAGSWLALPSNLLAIPWVSFIAVPLVLTGVALLPFPALAGPVLELAWWSCAALHEFLQSMAGLEGGRRWLTPSVGILTALLGAGGGLLVLLPRGLAPRWLGALLLVMVVVPRAPTLDAGEYAVETLDVGQGQAVLVATRNHSLLYDTGPGGGLANGTGWSLFDSVLAPALAADGRARPDLVTVSHADLDHAGGLDDYRARFGDAGVRINLRDPEDGLEGCHQGQEWTWDGVRFRVLHPSRWLPYLGNDSSCVIAIDNGRYRTLLSGDISSVIEARLAPDLGRYDLVTVPHHGSATSSSAAFVTATRPSWAVASAAYGNRFGFPRPEVVERYARGGAQLLSTIDCGAVRVEFPAEGLPRVSAARQARRGPWRWLSAHGCMASSHPAMYHSEGPRTEE